MVLNGSPIDFENSDANCLVTSIEDILTPLSVNQQLVSIPRVQISAIRLRTRTQRGIWIGLGLGAAAGAAVGAGIGSGVSNESGGDFSDLTPLVIGVCAGVGALVGLGI